MESRGVGGGELMGEDGDFSRCFFNFSLCFSFFFSFFLVWGGSVDFHGLRRPEVGAVERRAVGDRRKSFEGALSENVTLENGGGGKREINQQESLS